MRFRFVSYLIAAASVLLACSQDGKTAPKSTGTPEDFCHSFLATVSELQTRCFGSGESYWRDFYTRMYPCDGLAKEIGKGTVVYDQAKATSCIDQGP
jgi:hypothetical protein